MSNPIGFIRAGSEVVASNNILAVIGFVTAISINLALVNALPLPALDGGQMLFVLAEAVTVGRKIDQSLQELINSAALFFLLFVTFRTLFLFVLFIRFSMSFSSVWFPRLISK